MVKYGYKLRSSVKYVYLFCDFGCSGSNNIKLKPHVGKIIYTLSRTGIGGQYYWNIHTEKGLHTEKVNLKQE